MSGEDGGNNGPANSGDGGGNAGESGKTFTQADLDRVAGKARGEAISKLLKDAGLNAKDLDFDISNPEDFKGLVAAATEHKKATQANQGDVERLTGEVNKYKPAAEKVPALEKQILRQQIAGSEQLPVRLWKLVEGDDEDAIKASISELKTEFHIGDSGDEGDDSGAPPPQRPRGTGLAPNFQQGTGGGGGKPKSSLKAGYEAYAAKHGK